MKTQEREARRALARLRRALVKARRELDAMRTALISAEGDEFPQDDYADRDEQLASINEWLNGEEARLRTKVLRAGGIDPGRLRRSSGF